MSEAYLLVARVLAVVERSESTLETVDKAASIIRDALQKEGDSRAAEMRERCALAVSHLDNDQDGVPLDDYLRTLPLTEAK